MFKPVKTTHADKILGGDMNKLLPPYEDVPEEFKDANSENKWKKFFSDWFYNGIENIQLAAKDGIAMNTAMSHISAIMASHEPKHQVKEASCAYLLSIWFDDFKYDVVKKEEK